ncbi:MAG: 3-oxoacyl-ACP synthase III [Desulfobulbaceae bacterium]|nr:3-oxoacyl-ACP synthase III [Desulfobulbaceae bacterium]
MIYKSVCLYEFGYELPPNVVSSDDLEERMADVYERLKLPRGRLELMSGIRERRFWNPGTKPSRAAAMAGQKALTASKVNADEIECLIFTSVSRDMMEPATAAFVHNELGLPEKCLLFDLSNACLGFLNGMIMLAGMIESGQVNKGLIVAGETAEGLVESTINAVLADKTITRKSIKVSFASLTIGSGAVALVMGRDDNGGKGKARLVGGVYRANTSQNHLCRGGDIGSGNTLMSTDAEELLKQGVDTAHTTWHDFKNELDWPCDSIDRFFCHQVGRAHARLLFETLSLDPEKGFETLDFLGNVGSVSAPITMAMGVEQGLLESGRRAALLGIGSGINCVMLGIEFM